MVNSNSSGGSMRRFNNEEISKAIRMALANVSMEEDFCLNRVEQRDLQQTTAYKVLVFKKGGLKNGSENTQRN